MDNFGDVIDAIASSFFIRFGSVFTLVGILLMFAVFSEFDVEGLFVAGGFLLLGIVFLILGSFLIEASKRKLIFVGSISWVGTVLTFFPIMMMFILWSKGFSWSDPNSGKVSLVIFGGFISGLVLLLTGALIVNGLEYTTIRERVVGVSKREPLLVLLLSIVTFGIYHVWWLVKTRREINACGANIPSPWLMIIPIVSLFFFAKYTEGFSLHVAKDMHPKFWLSLYLAMWPAAVILIQKELNRLAA